MAKSPSYARFLVTQLTMLMNNVTGGGTKFVCRFPLGVIFITDSGAGCGTTGTGKKGTLFDTTAR